MMDVQSGFATNGAVRLHYLEAGTEGPPVLIAPGLSDGAEDYLPVMSALTPRRAVAMSFRGRGRSDTPDGGYDLEHHIADIDAVVEDRGLRGMTLFAHSRAVPYAIGYAAGAPTGRVANLILGDNIPVHRSFDPEWIDSFAAGVWRGRRVDEQVDRALLVHLQRESRHVDLFHTLAGLSVPRTVILAGTHPPDRLAQVSDLYRRAGTEVSILAHSGHDLTAPDPGPLVALLAASP